MYADAIMIVCASDAANVPTRAFGLSILNAKRELVEMCAISPRAPDHTGCLANKLVDLHRTSAQRESRPHGQKPSARFSQTKLLK
jgi:hypothetical protein